jgi:hypothetical protein
MTLEQAIALLEEKYQKRGRTTREGNYIPGDVDTREVERIDREITNHSERLMFRQYVDNQIKSGQARVTGLRINPDGSPGALGYVDKFTPDEDSQTSQYTRQQKTGRLRVGADPNQRNIDIGLGLERDFTHSRTKLRHLEKTAWDMDRKHVGMPYDPSVSLNPKYVNNQLNKFQNGAQLQKEYSDALLNFRNAKQQLEQRGQNIPAPLPAPGLLPREITNPEQLKAFRERGKLADKTWRPEVNEGGLNNDFGKEMPAQVPNAPMVAPPKMYEDYSKGRSKNPFLLGDQYRIKGEGEKRVTPYNVEAVGTLKAGNLDMSYNPEAPEDSPGIMYKRNLEGLPGYVASKGASVDNPYEGSWLEPIARGARNVFDKGKSYADAASNIMSGVGGRVKGIGESIMGGLKGFSSGIGAVQNVLEGVEGITDTLGRMGKKTSRWWNGDTEATDAMGKEAEDRVRQFENAERYKADQTWAADAQQTGMQNAYGKVAWVGDSKDGTRRMISKLDKYQQQKKDLAGQYAAMLAEKGKTLGDDAEGGMRDTVRESLLKNFESANGQRFKDEQRALETKLLNQGMSPDSAGFRKQMGLLMKEQEAARNDAINTANVQSYQLGSQAFNDRLAAFGQQGNLFQMYDQFKDPTEHYQSGAMHGGNVFTGNTLQAAQQGAFQEHQLAQQESQFQQEMKSRQEQHDWQSKENALEREQRSQDLENERLWKTDEGKLERELKAAGLSSQERMMVAKLKNEVQLKTGEYLHDNEWKQWLPKMLAGGGSFLSGLGTTISAAGGVAANFIDSTASNIYKKLAAKNLLADTHAKWGEEQRARDKYRIARGEYYGDKYKEKRQPEPVDNDPVLTTQKTKQQIIDENDEEQQAGSMLAPKKLAKIKKQYSKDNLFASSGALPDYDPSSYE